MNMHVAEQLDRHITSVALRWVPDLSHHRPVLWSRSAAEHGGRVARPIPVSVLRHPDWVERVAHAFLQERRKDRAKDSAVRRLVLLKRAIKAAAESLERGSQPVLAETVDDQVGVCMAFLRAVELHHWGHARRLALRLPRLAQLVDLQGARLHLDPGLGRVRDFAIELYRQSVLQEAQRLQEQAPELPAALLAARKGKLRVRISKLRPGTSTSVPAVRTETGHIATDPAEMARAIASHWERVLGDKQLDERQVHEWLVHSLPGAGAGLPAATGAWRIRRRDGTKQPGDRATRRQDLMA